MTRLKLDPAEAFESLVTRYFEKVVQRPGCWGWTGCKTDRGYGVTSVCGENVRVHRASWEIHFGPIPKGEHVLHHCDNPECSNPAHLYLGDELDNARDRKLRGRQSPTLRAHTKPGLQGCLHYRSKLTVAQVLAIRADLRPVSAIGREHSVSHQTVSRIKSRTSYLNCN